LDNFGFDLVFRIHRFHPTRLHLLRSLSHLCHFRLCQVRQFFLGETTLDTNI